MMEGIDFAGHSALDYAGIAQTKSFVVRYLSGVSWKDVTLDELNQWNAHGVGVAFVWELGATDPEQGYNRGVLDAQRASAQLRGLGVPNSIPIYFAVDEDTSFGPNLTGYFKGIRDTIGFERSGCYGSYAVVKGAFDNGLIKYGWQTYAWSGGRWDVRAQLRQYRNGMQMGNLSVDFCSGTTIEGIGAYVPPVDTSSNVPQQTTEVDISKMVVLQQGSTGVNVIILQFLLNAGAQLGFGKTVATDGHFGPATTESVKLNQSQSGLVSDGIVGAATYSKLLGL